MERLYTIGHSRHEPQTFTDLLKAHGIEAVYDVRSKPYSRFSPQFRRENLARILAEEGIGYVFIGERLGGKPKPAPALFAAGLEALRADAGAKRIAVMCAEKDPLNCHRCWTIAQNLPDMEVMHILSDGALQSHAALMQQAGPVQRELGL